MCKYKKGGRELLGSLRASQKLLLKKQEEALHVIRLRFRTPDRTNPETTLSYRLCSYSVTMRFFLLFLEHGLLHQTQARFKVVIKPGIYGSTPSLSNHSYHLPPSICQLNIQSLPSSAHSLFSSRCLRIGEPGMSLRSALVSGCFSTYVRGCPLPTTPLNPLF